MKLWITFLCLWATLSACSAAEDAPRKVCEPSITTSGGRSGICKGDLIFEDNFDFLDMNKWSHEVTMAGGGNWEFQIYWGDPVNSFTKDGNLVLHPGKTADIYGEDFLSSGTIDLGPNCTASWFYGCVRTGTPEIILNPTTSARLHTVNTFSFKYGTIEVRAKAPAGDWLWPVIWLMPRDEVYGGWPMSGEIDIMESRGNRHYVSNDGVNIGLEQMASTLHWGPGPNMDAWARTRYEKNNPPGVTFDTFHTYRLEWTTEHIMFSLDGEMIAFLEPPQGGFWELGQFDNSGVPNPWPTNSKMAPFDQEFFVILCLAVGGTNGYFPDGMQNPGGKPWSNSATTAFTDFWRGRNQWEPTWGEGSDMLVDYVRVWAA